MKIEKWLGTNFDKKTDWALVTGASSGIGLEYLKAFAKLGCNVLSVCNQKELNIEVSEKYATEFGVKIEPIYTNLSSQTEVDQLIDQLKKYSIRVFISNAGFGIKGIFTKIAPDKYKDIIGVHVAAPTLLTQSILNDMLKSDKGLIIQVASVNVASPIPGNTVYTATKFYQYGFSLALAYENKDSNIVFQTLLPGTTDTPFHVKQGATPIALTMKPNEVVKRSLDNINKKICIPNRIDRFGFPFLSRLPMQMRIRTTKQLMKRRLTF